MAPELGIAAGKIRLNVSALLGQNTVAKFVHCANPNATVEETLTHIQGVLNQNGVEGHIVRLTNAHGSNLPSNEAVVDALRDGEEVIVVVSRQLGDKDHHERLQQGEANRMNLVATGDVTQLPGRPEAPQAYAVPGPCEVFEDDHAATTATFARPPAVGSDWGVESLTPKLREFISHRFQDSSAATADPGRTALTITMRPSGLSGSIVTPHPLTYQVARVDIIDFERLCSRKVQEVRTTLDYIQRCQEALQALTDAGTPDEHQAPNMLPYHYREPDEVRDVLAEVSDASFGQVDGFRPMILIDTSGKVGERVSFIRAALKHMLYSFLVAKSKFNFVKFLPSGQAAPWAKAMVSPVTQVLREAEEWIDALKPVKASPNYLEGFQAVLSPQEVDCVYVISSGFPSGANIDYIIQAVRSMNLKDVPVNVISVEAKPKAELELRRLAEESQGIFRTKTFHKAAAAEESGGNLLRDSRILSGAAFDNSGQDQLSIRGQRSILAVMQEEQEKQKTNWLEEQTCANRLLLATSTQPAVPEPEEARKALQRSALAETGRLLESSHPSRMTVLTGGAHSQSAERLSQMLLQGATGGGQEAEVSIGKPSIANPWDRPTLKGSQTAPKMGSTLRSTSRNRSGRPCSAGRRSSSRSAQKPFR
mmetsp:Transcript_46395/g.84930  ORF Transcript_46395/g.84930 Transcript_46395/m.84930 type:complete len:650 (-) Transcript_46395:146-2095(-)